MEVSPTIALTLGDPAGIGPEIIVKAFQDEILTINTRVLVVGDAKTQKKVAQKNCPRNSNPFNRITR
jgi:4-hydroxythreonine-4-phosphate dehydrogenase